jgi:hypothetical protein
MRGLLIVSCLAVAGVLLRAQEPDLSEIRNATRAGASGPADGATLADVLRRLNAPGRFRTFSEFRGTWVLDEKATEGIRYAKRRTGEQIPYDTIGMEIARRIVITGSDADIVLAKDDRLPEPYGFDGAERQSKDTKSGALLDPRYSFALVAGAIALTSRTKSCCDADGRSSTEIITDAYRLAGFDVLMVERQFSILREPPGSLMTLSRLRALPYTITYRRAP